MRYTNLTGDVNLTAQKNVMFLYWNGFIELKYRGNIKKWKTLMLTKEKKKKVL
jgi:hypothetical protein